MLGLLKPLSGGISIARFWSRRNSNSRESVGQEVAGE